MGSGSTASPFRPTATAARPPPSAPSCRSGSPTPAPSSTPSASTRAPSSAAPSRRTASAFSRPASTVPPRSSTSSPERASRSFRTTVPSGAAASSSSSSRDPPLFPEPGPTSHGPAFVREDERRPRDTSVVSRTRSTTMTYAPRPAASPTTGRSGWFPTPHALLRSFCLAPRT